MPDHKESPLVWIEEFSTRLHPERDTGGAVSRGSIWRCYVLRGRAVFLRHFVFDLLVGAVEAVVQRFRGGHPLGQIGEESLGASAAVACPEVAHGGVRLAVGHAQLIRVHAIEEVPLELLKAEDMPVT